MCHGADGAGQTPTGKKMKVRDLRSPEVQKMSDKELTTLITEGKGKMLAYKGKLAPNPPNTNRISRRARGYAGPPVMLPVSA